MPIERLLVIADAHIGAASAESEAALLRFLAEAPSLGDGLLVAGDLFEFWFAWRRAVPSRGFPVAAALAALAARMPVSMVGGNHDRWGRPFWTESTPVTWSPQSLALTVAGRSLVTLHGDGVAEGPGRVGWSHRLVGHPATSAAFSLLHPDLGLWLVRRLAPFLSEPELTPEILAANAARQLAYARRTLAASPGTTTLVMGHTHVPALEECAPGQYYVNPGTWLDGGRYAVISASAPELRQF